MSIAFEQVSFSYDGAPTLTNVTFLVEDGEFLGVVGPTGSGKSTLIRHMNGLLHPDEGRVCVDGADLADKGAGAAARSVGVAFQYPEHQLFAATVAQDVAFGPRNQGLSSGQIEERVDWALESVGLPASVKEASPFELSGGQQRCVALAGVLAMRPRALVLDEPTAGLDPEARTSMLALVRRLHAEEGLTIVMTSHNMDDLAQLSDRILVLNEGRVFALGTPAQVFTRLDDLRAIGLDAPFAQAFAHKLRARGIALPRALYDIDSLAADLAALYSNV